MFKTIAGGRAVNDALIPAPAGHHA
jgi:hypothetical protein